MEMRDDAAANDKSDNEEEEATEGTGNEPPSTLGDNGIQYCDPPTIYSSCFFLTCAGSNNMTMPNLQCNARKLVLSIGNAKDDI